MGQKFSDGILGLTGLLQPIYTGSMRGKGVASLILE